MRVYSEKPNVLRGNAISVATNLLTLLNNWRMGWAAH